MTQHGVTYRNKNVEICPIGALAFYYFYRFHHNHEPWPDFSNREQWYSIKVLAKAKGPVDVEIDYNSHLEVINKAFKHANVSLKGTHTGRREGCRLADLLSIPDAQMRRLGRWDNSKMTIHYTTGIPLEGARILAGHHPDKGMYFLERDCLEPPLELQRMIFPQLEYSRAKNEQLGDDKMDTATVTFLQLLEWFRILILQDAVFLREKFSGLAIWNQPPFNHPEFHAFAQKLKTETHDGVGGLSAQFGKILGPHIMQVMNKLRDEMDIGFKVTRQCHMVEINQASDRITQQTVQQIEERFVQPMALTQKLISDGLPARLHVDPKEISFMPLLPAPSGTRAAHAQLTIASHMNRQITAAPAPKESVPQVPLQDWVQTIDMLWEEYDKGVLLMDGTKTTPIRELDEKFKAKWRSHEKYRNSYSRRKLIWEAVIEAAKTLKLPPDDVAKRMEKWRKGEQCGLHKLNEKLRLVKSKKEDPIWGPNYVNLLQIPTY